MKTLKFKLKRAFSGNIEDCEYQYKELSSDAHAKRLCSTIPDQKISITGVTDLTHVVIPKEAIVGNVIVKELEYNKEDTEYWKKQYSYDIYSVNCEEEKVDEIKKEIEKLETFDGFIDEFTEKYGISPEKIINIFNDKKYTYFARFDGIARREATYYRIKKDVSKEEFIAMMDRRCDKSLYINKFPLKEIKNKLEYNVNDFVDYFYQYDIDGIKYESFTVRFLNDVTKDIDIINANAYPKFKSEQEQFEFEKFFEIKKAYQGFTYIRSAKWKKYIDLLEEKKELTKKLEALDTEKLKKRLDEINYTFDHLDEFYDEKIEITSLKTCPQLQVASILESFEKK